MISILLNSRNKDYENPGNVTQFLESLYRSIYNKKNVEVIFKFDIDDEISTNQFLNCVTTYPDLQLKCIITPRYYYKGLHLGYYECFKLIDDKSKIIICMADDFLFTETNWDTELLNVTSKFMFSNSAVCIDYHYMLFHKTHMDFTPIIGTKSDAFRLSYNTDVMR